MRPVVVVVVVFFSWAGAWTVPPHGARAASARHSFKGGLPDPTKDDGTAERIAQAEKEMWESFSPAQRTVKTAERAAITTLCEGRIAEALEQFDVALENSEGNRLLWQRGSALYFGGRWEDAANDFERNAETFEEMLGEPATEYLIWRAAALCQLARGDERRETPPDISLTPLALVEHSPLLQNAFDLFSIDGEACETALSKLGTIASPKRVSRSEQFDTDELQRVQDLDDSAIDAHFFAGLWAESALGDAERARAHFIAAADASRRIAEAPRRFPNPAIGGLAFRLPEVALRSRAWWPDGGVRPDLAESLRPARFF